MNLLLIIHFKFGVYRVNNIGVCSTFFENIFRSELTCINLVDFRSNSAWLNPIKENAFWHSGNVLILILDLLMLSSVLILTLPCPLILVLRHVFIYVYFIHESIHLSTSSAYPSFHLSNYPSIYLHALRDCCLTVHFTSGLSDLQQFSFIATYFVSF